MIDYKYWWLICLAAISLNIMHKDITKRKITNKQCLMLLLIIIPVIMVNGQSVLFFNVILIIIFGVVLNELSILGAGDSKLFAVYSLAIKPDFLLSVLFLIIVLGGLFSFGYYLKFSLMSSEQVKKRGVPYGVPICIGSYLGVLASLLG